MNPDIIFNNDSQSWQEMVLSVLEKNINDCILENGQCNIMLTGGRSAREFYRLWSESSFTFQAIHFFFGDERCVPAEHNDSNYGMVMNILFQNGLPLGCSIERMKGEDSDRESAALSYEEVIPEKIDILLLSMGEDGHVASLFPGNDFLKPTNRNVVYVTGGNPSLERLTITAEYIKKAKNIFVFVCGKKKANKLREAIINSGENVLLPVSIVMSGTFLLDAEAAAVFNGMI